MLSLAIGEDLNLEFDIEIPKLYKQYTDEILPEDRYVGFSLGASGFEKLGL